jgi:membrane protein YdbS with pleckstrin-like domain
MDDGERLMKIGVLLTIAIMILCIILVPLTAYFIGGWYAYWSHAILAIIFALAVVLLKTKWYWEEE